MNSKFYLTLIVINIAIFAYIYYYYFLSTFYSDTLPLYIPFSLDNFNINKQNIFDRLSPSYQQKFLNVSNETLTGPVNKYAYTFYVTNEIYLCNAFLNAQRLIDLKKSPDIDIVIFTSTCFVFPKYYIKKGASLGIYFRLVEDMPDANHHNWGNSLVKLRLFDLIEYERVILFDTDSIVMKNLDHLFQLPDCELAASRGYWLGHQLCSVLLVAKPSLEISKRLFDTYFKSGLKRNYYDMDFLHDEFINTALLLPPNYMLLDYHWFDEQKYKNPMKEVKTVEELYEKAYIIHFSAVGKPWHHDSPEQLFSRSVNPHPIGQHFMRDWFKRKLQTCR